MSGAFVWLLLIALAVTFVGFVASLHRYVGLYERIYGPEHLLRSRIAASPLRFFTEYAQTMRVMRQPYETAQQNPELERRRVATKRWQWAATGIWAVIMVAGIASLFR